MSSNAVASDGRMCAACACAHVRVRRNGPLPAPCLAERCAGSACVWQGRHPRVKNELSSPEAACEVRVQRWTTRYFSAKKTGKAEWLSWFWRSEPDSAISVPLCLHGQLLACARLPLSCKGRRVGVLASRLSHIEHRTLFPAFFPAFPCSEWRSDGALVLMHPWLRAQKAQKAHRLCALRSASGRLAMENLERISRTEGKRVYVDRSACPGGDALAASAFASRRPRISLIISCMPMVAMSCLEAKAASCRTQPTLCSLKQLQVLTLALTAPPRFGSIPLWTATSSTRLARRCPSLLTCISHLALCYNMLQQIAMYCNVLQCISYVACCILLRMVLLGDQGCKDLRLPTTRRGGAFLVLGSPA